MKKLILFIFIITMFSCKNESKNTDKRSEKSNTDTVEEGLRPSPTFLIEKSETVNLFATLESNKEHFKKLDPIEFKLKITDKKAKIIYKAEVTMDLTMPDMAMPKNEIFLKEENGIYKGTALFTMKGKWRLITKIDTIKQKEIIYFDLLVE